MTDRPAYAVLTAAGSGSRLGCDGPKALVPVDGVPMVLLAAAALAAGGVSAMVITAPVGGVEAFAALFPGDVCPGHPQVPVVVVQGSPLSRQASVREGLKALETLEGVEDSLAEGGGENAVILVHDAARPLTPPDVTAAVIEAVRAGSQAVIPAVPVADTLKTLNAPLAQQARDEEGHLVTARVVDTPARSLFGSVQTPQGFRADILLDAHHRSEQLGAAEATAATDDAGLVEALGARVDVILGSPRSLKVTTAFDLALVNLLAQDQQAGT